MNLKKSAIALAVSVSMGGAVSAEAEIIGASWSGTFTILNYGWPLQNTSPPYYSDPTWSYGYRTQISGTLTLDMDLGTGTATVNPFEFFSGGPPRSTTSSCSSLVTALVMRVRYSPLPC